MKACSACALVLLLMAGFSRGQSVPGPPRQHVAWLADANIPTNILSAAETLFAQGFPDPRGCEFREIEVEVSGVWNGKGSLVKTRGWVLPESAGDTNRFAICWNGLIYPVATVGPPADLRSETTNTASTPYFRGSNNSAESEVRAVLFAGALSTRVLLLLRCGETELAMTNWP